MIPLLLLLACAPKPAPAPATPVAAAPAPTPADPLDTRPTIGAEVPFTPPGPTVTALSNGAKLWVVPNPALPLVTVVAQVAGGSARDPKGKEGTAALSDRLLTQGAGKRDATAFALAVEQLGIDLSVDTDRAASRITMSMRKENLDAALDLLADMVLRPRYTPADFQREQDLSASDVQVSLDELPVVAGRVAMAEWFGAAHPYGRPPDGTVAGLGKTTMADVRAYHTQAWNPAGAGFTVAGDVTAADVQARLEARLGAAWKAGQSGAVTPPPVKARSGTGWILVDKPGSAQTMFYLVFPGLPAGDDGLAAARAGTIALGGTFTSRLNALLREKRGFTYGARAGTAAWPGAGVLTIGTRIRVDATVPAMNDIKMELARIQEGVTAEELGKARGAYKQDQVEAMETRAGTASVFADYQGAGLGASRLAQDLSAMGAVTAEQVKAAMTRYDLSQALVVLVGDRAQIQAPLEAAGYGPFVIREEW